MKFYQNNGVKDAGDWLIRLFYFLQSTISFIITNNY